MALRRQLHEWLQPLNFKLEPILQQYRDSEIHLVIYTEKVASLFTKDILHRLPWQKWNLFFQNYSTETNVRKSYTLEAALCFSSNKVNTIVEYNCNKIRRVRIISIFGDSQGINTHADKELLSKLKKQGAELTCLTEPSRADFDQLWDEPCDILFFAGHSNTQNNGQTGVININSHESLSLKDIKKTLGAAVKKGLKLAIFNSCDGLGLATQLTKLNIPYIVVWREVVPDVIAQKFIEYFLNSFINNKCLFAAMEEARNKLCELANLEKQLPGITWLPIICKNTIQPPLIWSDLGGLTGKLPDNPYRGFAAFREEDTPFYFGRKNFIGDLLEAVCNKPLVSLIGASGSGKSSLVSAGLIPKLRTARDLGVVSFRPDNKPFDNLAVALNLPFLNADDETQLCRYIQAISSASGYWRFVLIIDQFEELLTLTPETERQNFLKALYFAIKNAPNFTLVLTLRSDFLEALSNSLLGKALQEHTPLLMAPMNYQELRDIIEKPALKMKVELHPGLTQKLINDVGNHPGRLPLLEFTLTQLWDKQENWYLTHQAYEEIGGLEKALAKHADNVLDELQLQSDENIYKAERIFIQLVSPGAGTEDIRRVATRQEIGDQNWDLVQKLASKRLVITGSDDINNIQTVEIIHEALIREWGTFHKWIKSNRSFRTWQERLKQDARLWEQNQKNPDSLLHGTQLSIAKDWYERRKDELTLTEQDYITESIRRQVKEHKERKLQRNLDIFGFIGVLIIISLLAGINETRRTDMEVGRLSIESEKDLNNNNNSEALIDALKAGKLYQYSIWKPWIKSTTKMQVASTLLKTIHNLQAKKIREQTDVMKMIFSPNGKTVASVSKNKTVKFWNAVAGEEIKIINGYTGLVGSVTFSFDSKTIAANLDCTVKLWNATTGQELKTLIGHNNYIDNVIFSPDGKTVATSSLDNTIKLWDISTGIEIKTLVGHTNRIRSVIFSLDGRTVASASDDTTVKVWDAITGKEIKTLIGHTNSVNSVVFLPDDKIASASDDKTMKLWDAITGKEIKTLIRHADIRSVIFSPDTKILASASDDKTVKLWDVNTLQEIKTFTVNTDSVPTVISHEGKTIAISIDSDNPMNFLNLDVVDLDNLLTRGCGLLKSIPNLNQESKKLCTKLN